MLTKNEISTLSLSPTKKDFVQIWNELLEVAGKLSERWDPTSTNESDPGIVILKALAGIADKLNYNIDKNTLEAFMPTAAQEDSMRKLCDMLGYSMKYYRSAETEVTIKYYNSDPSEDEASIMSSHGNLAIPKFTVITNTDKDISYFTTNQAPRYISEKYPSVTLSCMEGQIVKCESAAGNNIITLAHLSEGNKYYLPETQIAENGIFIYNVSNENGSIEDGTPWEKVDNLNVQARGAHVFKFGYNSYEGRPYVEFPEDCSELINDGLFIYYARTSGANGNVSVNTLTQIELPTDGNWSSVSTESFSATNAFAATTGANLETINQAYNSFKKTIGTFETLVTCRDYMNKIYTMTSSTGKSYVSNVLVTDIRNDLNRAVTICSCDDAGIFYKETPLVEVTKKALKDINGNEFTVNVEESAINHFDLVIYPYKSYTQIRNLSTSAQQAYDASFTYDPRNFENITIELQNTGLKTIAHNFVKPKAGDILSINNYLRLNAIVGTNNKVTAEEVSLLKEKIKIALANAFNMRELDFGEEIPFESLVDVIEHADHRIKVVSLNEPDLYTTFTVIDKVINSTTVELKEYAVASERWLTSEQATAAGRFEKTDSEGTPVHTFDTKAAREIYNKLVVRNILAGRVPLFKYNTTFTSDFGEKPYQVSNEVTFGSLPKVCQTYFSEAAADAPYLLWCDGAKPKEPIEGDTHIYGTGDTFAREITNPDAVANGADPDYRYTKTETPKEAITTADSAGNTIETTVPKYPYNTVKPGDEEKITSIKSECIITPAGDGLVEGITLAAGEQIKFRAPNFRTKETYPAYVNYHLHLNERSGAEAVPAKASNLYSLITKENWETLFNSNAVIRKELTQKVGNISVDENKQIINQIPNIDEVSLDTILYQSGCIKLYLTPAFTGIDENTDDFSIPVTVADSGSELNYDLTNDLTGKGDAVLLHSKTALERVLAKIDSMLYASGKGAEWQISYNLEYMPFDSATLPTWKTFVTNYIKVDDTTPKAEANNPLWRVYTGSRYPIGKYILGSEAGELSGGKLLPFSDTYFTMLDSLDISNRLQGIYIASDLGSEALPAEVANETEYKLKPGEYLCIEYTPSSTNEDGTTDDTQKPVTKVFKDTVIRPNGFTGGLKDSSAYALKGNSPVKTVEFKIDTNTMEVALFSLGVNEQIEIREPSTVTLNKSDFTDGSIYVYKNFNDCPELETVSGAVAGNRSSTYILKEGEYFFYTDKNKSELAYYSAGTGITVTGSVKIPKFDVIDISTILDNGISEIPWQHVSVSGQNDSIIFQEYQYKTLSQDDTLNKLQILDTASPLQLDNIWRRCSDVTYTLKGETTSEKLPVIDITGAGWEVQSLLEINASPSVPQVLRTTDKIKTSISLHGVKNNEATTLKVIEAEPGFPLAIKTNVTGQSTTGELKLANAFLNSTNADSFTFKITAEETPSVISVQKLASTDDETSYEEIVPTSAVLAGSTDKLNKGVNSWSQILLKELGSTTDKDEVTTNNALKLSTTILPNTYGIFSIYLKQDSGSTSISVLPGTDPNAVSFFNEKDSKLVNNKLVLRPKLNCICVKKSCDLYITSTAPDGLLCFDELRLVDVSYTDDDQATTYGLNLEQLGYLRASDETTWNEFDGRARRNLKNALTEEALEKVETRIQELNNDVASAKAALDEDKPKVEKIVEFLNSAIKELDNLVNSGGSDKAYKTDATLASLIKQFNDLETALTNEKDLQKSLEDNTAIEDITKRLAELLEGFDDIASLQEGLTTELANLYNSVLTNAENIEELSQDDIVDDFVNAITPDDSIYKSDIILKNYLKIASLNEINTKYDGQVNEIVSALAENKKEDLAKKVYSLKYYEILDLVKDLYDTSSGSAIKSIDDIFTDITAELARTSPDLVSVNSYLSNLKYIVKRLDLTALLNKIEFSATDLKYTELSQYLSDLQLVFDSTDSALVKAIDSAIELVAKQISTPTEANALAMVTAIGTIQNNIWATTKTSSDTAIKKIQAVLTNLDEFFDFTNNELKNSTLDDVLEEQLNALLKARAAVIKTTELFVSITDYAKLPFSTEAVLTVWPEYMKDDILEAVEPLYNNIRAIVRDLENNDDVTLTELDNRPVLKKLANITLFKKLYKRAKDLVYKSAQVKHRKDVIEVLSNSALNIPEVSEKLEAFTDSSNSKVIYNLATQLKAVSTNALTKPDGTNNIDDTNNVIAQQQILTELKEELAKLITLDEELLKITADMLSPSILLLEGLPEEDFYANVKTAVNTTKTGYKAKFFDREFSNLAKAITAEIAALNDLLSDYSKGYNKTLLPNEVDDQGNYKAGTYMAKLGAYKGAKDLIPEKENPAEWDIFKILLDDTLKAAWLVTPDQGNSYWIDLAGEKIATSDLPAYNYRYYDKDNNDAKVEGWYKSDNLNTVINAESYITNISTGVALQDTKLQEILTWLIEGEDTDGDKVRDGGVKAIGAYNIPESFRKALDRYSLEEQLLAEIKMLDKNNLFYYNTPVEADVAIEFNEGDSKLNTLMNPATNYDINNVNNSFVISKLDIGYLDSGIQIARSSRL